MKYFERVQNLEIEEKNKEGYCWMLANFDVAQEVAKRKSIKTVGDFRQAIYKEIGFAPAMLFSYKHLFKSQEVFVSALEKSFA